MRGELSRQDLASWLARVKTRHKEDRATGFRRFACRMLWRENTQGYATGMAVALPVFRDGKRLTMELAEIFVELLDEGTGCWRPVAAQRLGSNLFLIVGTIPQEEVWQFQPGQTVRCAEHTFSDGSRGLVAVERVDA